MTVSNTTPCRDLTITRKGAAAIIELDRNAARNAVTGSMRAAIAEAMPGFARDPGVYAVIIRSAVPEMFSAGRDLLELSQTMSAGQDEAARLLAQDYRLYWLLECFSKPTVSLIDGEVLGSGAGLTLYGTHRVAGENFTFAAPETAFGFFPDVGLAWVFARMPGQVGLFLGLTGRRIGRADAFRIGLVTHCIPATRFGEIEAGLSDADPVDPILDDRHEDPGLGELEQYREILDHCFSAESVEDILARLEEGSRRGGATGAWCGDVLAELKQRSPIALKVTFRHIREAAYRDLRQTLMLDYRLASRLIETHDFKEGVRARLNSETQQPRWKPRHIADVTEAMVERFFAYRPGRELILPTRQEMQAARV
ncbi:MAG: enoyl-CoA hydratase/isomerase family protein [Pseudomonadota bacterium]|nr:MAG: enoyl-CoA hydratase/isomerase family protein [Pseudomonadota bacterium]